MQLKKIIRGNISPKSVVHSGHGLFFAQNMMYRHTVTVYDRKYRLIKTISDTIDPARFGYARYKGIYRGSPVETAFTSDGEYAWVSNYEMSGRGFRRPGNDSGGPSGNYDNSFLYRIDTGSLKVDRVAMVGAVPKYVALTPDNGRVLVTNWCDWDMSVVDAAKAREVKRVKLGRFPRGVVLDRAGKTAWVAVMGSTDIAKVDLDTYKVSWNRGVGASPRHLCLDPEERWLYATLNGEGRVAKIDLATGRPVKKVTTGAAPRSMVLSRDGQTLYVVNYHANTVSKVRTSDMAVLQTVRTNHHPIGITYDAGTRQVWVACYSGSLMVFQD